MNPRIGIGIALVALAALYGMRGRELSRHRENIEDARMSLIGRGCAMAGLESPSAEFQACTTEASKQCHSRSGIEVENCARVIGARGTPAANP